MLDLFILILIPVSLWKKKAYHWRYYLLVNQKQEDLDMGNQTLSEMTKQNSIVPVFDSFFKFVLPFFKPELFDTGEEDFKPLKYRIVFSLVIFWISLSYVLIQFAIYI